MRKIAVYGKGGIGKSTTVQNLAAALACCHERKVMVVGCDPKADSTRLLLGHMPCNTVLDALRVEGEDDVFPDMFLEEGFAGIRCIESGGPEPGVGCAGRGIIAAIDQLERMGLYEPGTDYVLYDVLGDVVCGGFAMPLREGRASEVYIVVSGELMSLYAANNICKGIARYADTGGAKLAGIICNCRNVDNEESIVSEFAQRVGSEVTAVIPRHAIVQRAEVNRKTVVEYAPDCDQAQVYRRLAEQIELQPAVVVPSPLEFEELEELIRSSC